MKWIKSKGWIRILGFTHKDKPQYREWDILPRITLCRLKNHEAKAICFGWLIWGCGFAISFQPTPPKDK